MSESSVGDDAAPTSHTGWSLSGSGYPDEERDKGVSLPKLIGGVGTVAGLEVSTALAEHNEGGSSGGTTLVGVDSKACTLDDLVDFGVDAMEDLETEDCGRRGRLCSWGFAIDAESWPLHLPLASLGLPRGGVRVCDMGSASLHSQHSLTWWRWE